MPGEYEYEDLTREEAAAMLYRLADGVAAGSVTVGDRTIPIPEPVAIEIEREREGDKRELGVELEWPLSAEEEIDAAVRESDNPKGEASAEGAAEGGSADAVAVEDAPIEAPTEEELTGDEAGGASREELGPPDPTSVVEPGQVAEAGSNARFELFEDSAGEWRWRLVHDNGNVIADSGEGYSRKANAKKGLRSVRTNAPGAEIVEE